MSNIETQVWVLAGGLGVLLTVCGFLIAYWFKYVGTKLDLLISGQSRIEIDLVKQQKDIEYIRAEQLKMNDRFNLHGTRIQALESKKS